MSQRSSRQKKRQAAREDFTDYLAPIEEEAKEMFRTSERHFFKKVKQHPERDLEDFTRVIDQPDPSITTGNMESFENVGRKRLFSATVMSEQKSNTPIKSKKKLSINNTVEVYYYAPCSYNQHETDEEDSGSEGWQDGEGNHQESEVCDDEIPFEQLFSIYLHENVDQL